MESPTKIRKGKVIEYEGIAHLVLDSTHRTQGRQAGFVQTVLRNLNTNATKTVKFRTTERVRFVHTEVQKLEFSYVDQEGYHFLDPETYEDTVLAADRLEDQKKFLVENNTYEVLFIEGRAQQVQLPAVVEMRVIEAPEGIRGDTTNSAQKSITTESNLVVQVPLFIKKDDVIRVNTESGTYSDRVLN